MREINERFKDARPENTFETIEGILCSLGIDVEEIWYESGLDECWSLSVRIKDAPLFSSNGKGITKALARASAYAEFIERLQCGLHLYKLQAIDGNPNINQQSFAPDGKIMTVQELAENGEWMDHLIQKYGHGLTRKNLAEQCKAYACTEEDKILTIPFYSLFEDKYVYLPAAFVKQVYCSNGCCAGNTPQEALTHALSEITERKSTIAVLTSEKAVPALPDLLLRKFPTAWNIISSIRSSGRYDITLFDFSAGDGFPVVASRIIDRQTHRYNVNVCADPVLEIAIDRTLTELMQGKNIKDYSFRHNGSLLEEANDLPKSHNIWNQLETGNGLFSVDFFTEEISSNQACSSFVDFQDKNNHDLLAYMIAMYRKQGHPVYIRNYSFLGFHSYMVVIPGVSESKAFSLIEPICEYALGNMVCNTFRNAAAVDDIELSLLLTFYSKISTNISRANNFSRLAGIPLDGSLNWFLVHLTMSYAAYRLGRFDTAIKHLELLMKNMQCFAEDKSYFETVQRYLKLKLAKVSEDKIRIVLTKLYEKQDVDKLYDHLDHGRSPLDPYLLRCDCVNCEKCQYRDYCSYKRTTEIIQRVGEEYSKFTNGQAKENFTPFVAAVENTAS